MTEPSVWHESVYMHSVYIQPSASLLPALQACLLHKLPGQALCLVTCCLPTLKHSMMHGMRRHYMTTYASIAQPGWGHRTMLVIQAVCDLAECMQFKYKQAAHDLAACMYTIHVLHSRSCLIMTSCSDSHRHIHCSTCICENLNVHAAMTGC